MMDLITKATSEGNSGVRAAGAVREFMKDTLLPESYERMEAAMRAKDDTAITMPQLTKVVQWLMSELTRRPTESPGDSESSLLPTGQPSTDASA